MRIPLKHVLHAKLWWNKRRGIRRVSQPFQAGCAQFGCATNRPQIDGRLQCLVVDLANHDILRFMNVDSKLDDFGGGFSLFL